MKNRKKEQKTSIERVREGPRYLLGRVSYLGARRFLGRVAETEIAQLVALVEDVVADGDVDDGREEDAHPDGDVVREDAQRVPLVADPAPELSSRSARSSPPSYWKVSHRRVAVDWTSSVGLDVQTNNGRDHRQPKAHQAVYPQVAPEGRGAGRIEEDEEDVERHGKGPPRVRLHEPNQCVSKGEVTRSQRQNGTT